MTHFDKYFESLIFSSDSGCSEKYFKVKKNK